MKSIFFALLFLSSIASAQIVIAPGQTTTTPAFACPVYIVTCSGTPCDPTKPPPAGCKPPDPPTACDVMTPADFGAFTRQCDTAFGGVTYNGSYPTYGGKLVRYETLWGAFAPVGTVGGNTFKMPVGIKKFISLAVTAAASGTNRFAANISSGLGGVISMSTQAQGPGRFTTEGTICLLKFGGSNTLSITSNNTASATCKMIAGQTYYLNFAPANADGSYFCTKQDSCNLAYTIQKTN